MVHFVGAGPGAPDLITVRGKQYLEEAVVLYQIPGSFSDTTDVEFEEGKE